LPAAPRCAIVSNRPVSQHAGQPRISTTAPITSGGTSQT